LKSLPRWQCSGFTIERAAGDARVQQLQSS